MAKTDILGTNKVRTKPEYTAKTHWAGSVNFAAIFTAPVFYLLLPVLVLYVTGCFELLADFINKLAESEACNQYAVMGVVAVILWQFVVCWGVWRKEIKKYEAAPKYEYLFYNDIVEYRKFTPATPKFFKKLKAAINFIPTLIAIAIGIALIVLIVSNTGPVEPGPTPTPGDPEAPEVSVDWAAIWAAISGFFKVVFGAIWSFITNKDVQPILIAVLVILAIIILVRIVIKLIKSLKSKKSEINARTVPMRTLPAVISAIKKLPAPKYLVPDNCPRWLRKIIFWAPVRYNFGDVIISSPKGTDDDVVLSKIENPEELINYLSPIKPQPTEVASYSANR